MDYSPPGSPVHGILQVRILEHFAMSSSRRSCQPRNWTSISWSSGTGRQILYLFTTWEAPCHDKQQIQCRFYFGYLINQQSKIWAKAFPLLLKISNQNCLNVFFILNPSLAPMAKENFNLTERDLNWSCKMKGLIPETRKAGLDQGTIPQTWCNNCIEPDPDEKKLCLPCSWLPDRRLWSASRCTHACLRVPGHKQLFDSRPYVGTECWDEVVRKSLAAIWRENQPLRTDVRNQK